MSDGGKTPTQRLEQIYDSTSAERCRRSVLPALGEDRSQDGETSSAFADLWFKVGLALIMPKYMLES